MSINPKINENFLLQKLKALKRALDIYIDKRVSIHDQFTGTLLTRFFELIFFDLCKLCSKDDLAFSEFKEGMLSCMYFCDAEYTCFLPWNMVVEELRIDKNINQKIKELINILMQTSIQKWPAYYVKFMNLLPKYMNKIERSIKSGNSRENSADQKKDRRSNQGKLHNLYSYLSGS